MTTDYRDTIIFHGPVTFSGEVIFSETPPEISLDNLTSLTGTGTFTAADLVSTDDITCGDDLTVVGAATIGETLAVAGASALHATAITGALTVSTTTTLTGNVSCGAALTVTGTLDCNGAVDLAGATVTPPTGYQLVQVLEVAFVLSDLQGGLKASTGLPTNALILGCHLQISTALEFSAGTTTGVSAVVGNSGDADGYGVSVALAGSTGYRRPAPGALVGGVVAGGAGGLAVTFTATGGTPNLAEVSAGAGKVVVHYLTV